ncbi:MAG TPA: LptA/OstA family protein [Candidatus Sulfotelmatobacter sp.]|nr:LptA/OstA family protein [Candidatus Sulfotelmatobacter sp.]
MKFPAFVLLCLACGITTLSAQTNTATNGVDSILALVTTNRPAAPPATNKPDATPPREPLTIKSTGPLIIDMINHWATYSDNVHVTDGQTKLACEWLKANFAGSGESPTNIVAETNVVVDFVDQKGQKDRALGDKAVYNFQVQDGVTNETVTLTGDLPDHPPEVMQGPNYTNTLTGSKFVYYPMTKIWRVEQPSVVYWTTNNASGTNSRGNDIFSFPK